MGGLLDEPGRIDTLLEWWERDLDDGLGELPFPPDFPKMPGEPPRVQPSRKNPENWTDDGKPADGSAARLSRTTRRIRLRRGYAPSRIAVSALANALARAARRGARAQSSTSPTS